MLSRALQPVAWMYEYISLWYSKRIKPQKIAVPVICVGNLVMGGAGKTPTVLALVDMLKKNETLTTYFKQWVWSSYQRFNSG